MRVHLLLSRGKLLVATLILVLAACSEQLSNEELLERAQQARAAGKLRTAMIDVKTAMKQGARGARARAMLGEVLLRQRKLDEAIIEFNKSLELVQDPQVAALYAQAMLDSGQQEKLLEQQRDGEWVYAADNASFLALLARSQATSGDTFSAQQTVEEAVAIDADDPQVQLAQAVLLVRHTREVDKALELLQHLTSMYPGFEEAWVVQGNLAQASGDLETAEQAYAEVTRLNRFRLEERLALVAVLVEQEKYDQAAQELDKLEEIIPQHPHVNYAQAVIAMASGNPEAALEELAEVFNVAPRHAGSLYLAANANYRLGHPEAAENYLKTFLAAQPRNVSARQMAATVYLQSGEADKAVAIARQLQKDSPKNEATMSILAQGLSAQGEHAASVEIYTQLVQDNPDDYELHMQLGTELIRARDFDRAVEELEFAKELNTSSGTVRSRLVMARAASGDPSGAQEEIEEYRQLAPEDPQPSQLAARLALVKGDREKALEEFSRALELNPASPLAWEGLASMAMQDNDSATALKILNQALETDPNSLRALRDLAAVHGNRGEIEAMEKALQQAIDAHPDELEPRLMLARSRLNQGYPADAVSLLMEVRELYQADPRLHQLLSGAFLKLGQPDSAVNSSDRLLQLRPDSTVALAMAAEAERANGDLAEAEAHLRRIRELLPRDIYSRKLLLEVLLAQNKLEEAEAELEQLPEGTVPQTSLELARARIAFAKGDFDSSETLFRKVFEAEPGARNLLQLSAVLRRKGDTQEAMKVLKTWLNSNREDLLVLNELGVLYMAQGMEAEAAQVYNTMNTLQPDNVPVLNNLAWSSRKIDPGAALGYADEALAIAPDNLSLLDTRAMILSEKGEFAEALAINQEILDKTEQHPKMLLHRAQIMLAAGDEPASMAILEQLIAGDDSKEKTEAQAMLSRIRGTAPRG